MKRPFQKYHKRYLLKIAEEASELATAIAKLLLWRDDAAWTHFLEELVDVQAAIEAYKNTGVSGKSWMKERFEAKVKKIKEQVEQ